MAGACQTGPVCAYGKPVVVDDGTSCRAQTPRPGSVDSEVRRSFVTVGEFLDHDYQTIKASLQHTYQGLGQGVRSNYEGARCLYQACQRAEELAPGAVLRETGYELQSLLEGLIPGLLQMIVVVGATTFLGAAIGGIVGFFFGGVGAVPGAAVGGEIGFDVGLAFLTWLGVAFLAVSIAKGFGEMIAALQNGIDLAWRARNLQGSAEEKQVEQAAQELARTVGILVRLILQAIVAYLLKKAAVSATRGAMSTAGALRAEGAAAVSNATVAELVGKLRASKFGPGFADWVERNWRDLVKDPRLQKAGTTKASTKPLETALNPDEGGPRPLRSKQERPDVSDSEEQDDSKPRDPMAERKAANRRLRNSQQFERDLKKAGISREQLKWMDGKEAPLGFENPAQFSEFKQDLAQALSKSGLDDAKVGMKGTATTFYSENPQKPLGHFWDADPENPGDYDLNLASDKMAEAMQSAGKKVSPKYGIFRTVDVESEFPEIRQFSAKWGDILGREVNVVGYPAGTVPLRDPTEFILVP